LTQAGLDQYRLLRTRFYQSITTLSSEINFPRSMLAQ
jgi:hypothetical protein